MILNEEEDKNRFDESTRALKAEVPELGEDVTMGLLVWFLASRDIHETVNAQIIQRNISCSFLHRET